MGIKAARMAVDGESRTDLPVVNPLSPDREMNFTNKNLLHQS
jgi:hypothetical protein